MAHSHAFVDQNQANVTKLLKQRTHDVYKWKSTLERAIKAQMDEISSLEEQKNRLLQALRVLEMPESIGKFEVSLLGWFIFNSLAYFSF